MKKKLTDNVSISTGTLLGNNSGSTGAPLALTATQATAMLDTVTTGAKGLAPATGGGTTNFLRADGTWAAPAGGGGASCRIPISGQWFGPATGVSNGTAPISVDTGTVYAWPISFAKAATIDQMGLSATTNASGGAGCKFGIYTSDATTGLPSTLVTSATLASAYSNTGVALSATLAANTVYWLAILIQGTGAALRELCVPQFTFGSTSLASVTPKTCATCTSTYATGLPSTFGTVSYLGHDTGEGFATGVPTAPNLMVHIA